MELEVAITPAMAFAEGEYYYVWKLTLSPPTHSKVGLLAGQHPPLVLEHSAD